MLFQGSNTTYNNSVMDCRIVLDELGFDVLVRLFGENEYKYRNNCELMQYTGLHDKNGKEIYEGDIVKLDEGLNKIAFQSGCFTAINILSFDGECNDSYNLPEINDCSEIIGNIWDNPELLKEGE